MPLPGGCLRQPLLTKTRQQAPNGLTVGGKHIRDLEALDEATFNGPNGIPRPLAKLSKMMPRKDLWTQALVALICISVGVLHPLATEQAKSGLIFTCQQVPGDPGRTMCTQNDASDSEELLVRKGMPFHKATLTVVSQSTAVVTSALVTCWSMGSDGYNRLRNGPALVRMAPVGFLYGFGDFLQTVACNAASAPVVLVMGQSKLLLTALFSKMVFGSKETDWHRLAVISCAAAASTDISAGTAANTLMHWNELRGGLLALLKASLSSAGAVLSERDYKKDVDSFWVLSFRVQLLMLTASLTIMPWTCSDWDYTSPTDFFRGGSDSLCAPSPEARCELNGELACTCMDRVGWDVWTMLAAFAIVINGFVTGLVLKYLSAVTKSVCGALSTGVFYVSYVCLGYRAFNVAQANVLAIVVLSSYEYAMTRHRRKASAAAPLK